MMHSHALQAGVSREPGVRLRNRATLITANECRHQRLDSITSARAMALPLVLGRRVSLPQTGVGGLLPDVVVVRNWRFRDLRQSRPRGPLAAIIRTLSGHRPRTESDPRRTLPG